MINDNNDLALLRRLQTLVAELKATSPELELLKCKLQHLIEWGRSERAIENWCKRKCFDAKVQAHRALELEIEVITEKLKINI